MKIQDLNSALRGIDPRDAQKLDRSSQKPKGAEAKTDDGDALELSTSARISITSPSSPVSEELSTERIAEIRDRIQSGFYNQPAVAAETVQRLAAFYSR
jgi:anti-sigma28 factor (negative regulator of flagellin synthesis)